MSESDNRLLERELFFRQLPGLRLSGAPPPESMVVAMLGASKDVHHNKGEHLFEEGDPSERIFFLQQGEVELIAEDAVPWKFATWDALGILDSLIGRHHQRTAIAVTPVSSVCIHAEDYFAILEDHVRYTQGLLRNRANWIYENHSKLPNRKERYSMPMKRRLVRKDAVNLGMVERLLILRKVPAFARSSIQPLVSLATGAISESYPKGAVLFREGDVSNRFWVVADGRVEISRDGVREAERGPGELVESAAAFGHLERQFTAKAATDILLVVIEEEELFDRMEEHFELMRSVLAYLAVKWEQVNEALALGAAETSTEISAADVLQLAETMDSGEPVVPAAK